ncbi:MAG TPA: hypothetical protein VFW65_18140 [Pseudonocardiaceae bacterium]|nr:hypothetical protein [Pseudonocardiaceae bacterium]
MVHIHVTDNLPIQARALPFAGRVEVRFGRAFPVVLLIDAPALDRLTEALLSGQAELTAAITHADTDPEGEST